MIENAGTANLMIFAVGRQQARRMPARSGRRRKGSLAEMINGELIVDNFAGGGKYWNRGGNGVLCRHCNQP